MPWSWEFYKKEDIDVLTVLQHGRKWNDTQFNLKNNIFIVIVLQQWRQRSPQVNFNNDVFLYSVDDSDALTVLQHVR